MLNIIPKTGKLVVLQALEMAIKVQPYMINFYKVNHEEAFDMSYWNDSKRRVLYGDMAKMLEDFYNSDKYIIVKTFTPRLWSFKYRNTLATHSARYKNGVYQGSTIAVNSRKLKRHNDAQENFSSICGSLRQEIAHALEYFYKHICYVGHGDNNRDGKANTFPYLEGRIAKRMALQHLT